ncbi:unnamed protein product [Didymodactylos carnosus]|uniref:Uncharacterized protein n=1 Tax=Didymodactylos carnosus TaxID=1234261 RepID=A0A814QU48_9BILA|nr:unnamed protein product [Didymodactylos carnosus]CAF3887181.1 unnamed protein product [Didymodactylos carnosus]
MIEDAITSAADEARMTDENNSRTRLFIHRIFDLLPISLRQQFLSLDAHDYPRPKDIKNNILNTLSKTVPDFSADELGTMIESIRAQMVHRLQNDIIKLRCGEPCPICKVPCHLEAGYNSYEIDLLKLSGQAIVGRAIQILLTA